ncbi:MAG: adenylosuccinate lyase [Candidatus Buchananbacteria bacterium RIFCSPHIGHO2_01_FULL_39_14]|uniref:Adenylosuccinate lyase n=2 Tax=Candidatus Buchananiibacteriota TaxID=1817903 RepID=A0A1G1YWX6_9BACT|nr:MAG: adenylosuccinate lyase [Candidatus Buchananbacteria bacterium RIFCSPHIGHO2_01_FULL_39_14]OGY55907.1 MAG: adenylosuccinate lyase [Candidatus Buchananbacteria bacterium RIFCSPLOWO2_01_FULL_40_23b]
MIKRFTRPEVEELFSILRKKQGWHDVETAVVGAREKLGDIPAGIRQMVAAIVITPEILKRADEIEAEIDHDLLALILSVAEQLEEEARPCYHDGLTSYDDEDTALAVILVLALELIIGAIEKLCSVVYRRAVEHKETVMVARTHFIHAKPYVFSLWFFNLLDDLNEHLKVLRGAIEVVGVGKISGAVGTYTLPPEIEEIACRALNLQAAKISTQIISRRVHCHFASVVVEVANTLEKYATDIRLMAGTDLSEVEEWKSPKAHGSSAMPGKTMLRNPIKSENVCGLAKVARGYLLTAFECQNLWLQRTLDNSSAERVWLPDLTTVVHFMLGRFTDVLDKLVVYPRQMEANLWRTGGMVFAEDVMMALTETGMARPEAYELLEGLARQIRKGPYTTDDGKTYRSLVYSNPTIVNLLGMVRLDKLFDPWNSLKNVQSVYGRFGI